MPLLTDDEFNQAKGPGNYGWPYFIGANGAFPYFNYATGKPGPKKDPARPLNDSVNNTGVRELPPAVPALIYYPYAMSETFPELGTGARSAMGGPIFHKADFPKARRLFPDYYEGKWIVGDLSRGLIMAVTLTSEGAYAGMERFLPSYRPVEPIDMIPTREAASYCAEPEKVGLSEQDIRLCKAPDIVKEIAGS